MSYSSYILDKIKMLIRLRIDSIFELPLYNQNEIESKQKLPIRLPAFEKSK